MVTAAHGQVLCEALREAAFLTREFPLSPKERSTTRIVRLVFNGRNAGGSAPARRQATKTPTRSIFSRGTKPVTCSALPVNRAILFRGPQEPNARVVPSWRTHLCVQR